MRLPPRFSPDARTWWDGRTWVTLSSPPATAESFEVPAGTETSVRGLMRLLQLAPLATEASPLLAGPAVGF